MAVIAAIGAIALAGCSSGDGNAVPTLHWYTYDEPGGSFTDSATRCTEAANGQYKVEVVVLPNDADQQREQLVRRLAAGDSSIDLMSMDVIWTAEFAGARWVLPYPADVAARATDGRLQGAVDSATYLDQLWAAPFTGNSQLLWYRTDRAPTAPATWDQMIAEAEAIGPGGGIEAQGARYEGLTVFFNSMLASAGGTILNEDGTEVSLEEEPTHRALEVMREYGRSSAADPTLSTGKEDDARLGFESGRSTFMVNYPFVYPSAVKNNPDLAAMMAWAPFPGVDEGVPGRSTYGGFNLGVAAYTKHPDLAFEAAACLADDAGQRAAAIQGGLAPTTAALYDDPVIREQYPFADALRQSLATAAQRPQSPVYADISLAIQRTLHPISKIDPDRDVQRLRDAISDALESKGLL